MIFYQSSTLHAMEDNCKSYLNHFLHFLSGEPIVSEVDHILRHEEDKEQVVRFVIQVVMEKGHVAGSF